MVSISVAEKAARWAVGRAGRSADASVVGRAGYSVAAMGVWMAEKSGSEPAAVLAVWMGVWMAVMWVVALVALSAGRLVLFVAAPTVEM
jgi:hypothetical protein